MDGPFVLPILQARRWSASSPPLDHCQSKEVHTWHKTPPNEPVNHVFGLKIQRAPWAAARGLLQHIATISTRLCAMGVGPLIFKFSKEAIRDLLRKDVMHYATGPGTLVPLRFKMGLSPQYARSQESSDELGRGVVATRNLPRKTEIVAAIRLPQ